MKKNILPYLKELLYKLDKKVSLYNFTLTLILVLMIFSIIRVLPGRFMTSSAKFMHILQIVQRSSA